MRTQINLIVILLFFNSFLFSQEYGYTRYDLKEGLAGSTVSCMVQDKDGFLWFGTETGLSRFDGTHFKNFTQQDGLPDDDIIKLHADKKGRVWISPFKRAICYYYNGKIHNEQNDTLLKKIAIRNLVIAFAEDEEGNLLLHEANQFHLVGSKGEVTTFNAINGQPIEKVVAVGPSGDGGFLVVETNRIFKFRNNRFTLIETIPFKLQHTSGIQMTSNIWLWRHSIEQVAVRTFSPRNEFKFTHSLNQMNYSLYDDRHFAVCTNSGVYVYDINDPEHPTFLLPHVGVFNVMKDFEGNLWFATAGQGVYRLNSSFAQNLYAARMTRTKKNIQRVTDLARYKSSVLVAADKDQIFRLSAETGRPDKEPVPIRLMVRFPIIKLCVIDDEILYACKFALHKMKPNFDSSASIPGTYVKALFPYKSSLYVGTNTCVFRMDPKKFIIQDTVWNERVTSLYVDQDILYVGTLNGLNCRFANGSTAYLGDRFPEFKQRISAIGKDHNETFWIGTYGAGVIGYKNGKVIARINTQHGLTSNICTSIFLHENALWVGTNKGLNKVDLTSPAYQVMKYTTGDGLISDAINVIYVEGSKVFVGTAEGITFFDEEKIDRYSRCDLRFTDITIGGQSQQWNGKEITIPHEKNNIRFDYVALSYKSAGDIRYRYKLAGLDTAWKETRETYLNYPTLPSGTYELQLIAINKFDVNSKILSAKFTIEKLLWEKNWFRIMAGLVFLGVTGLLTWGIIYRIRRREQEKTSFSRRIGELEQLARKAQMNPHFIFNSLNSIQQYVMDADLAGANKFISGFSKLIRQTLDFSSKQEISLEEEIGYLKNYLELEKSRLEDAFSWSVDVAPDINPSVYFLPPMLLQPFVENSIRHGLRLRKDSVGKLTVSIKKQEEYLICVVADNGVGRKAAQLFKSSSHIEYQSKGMSLTAERIAMLNKDQPGKITMRIDDLEDEMHKAMGTRVTISFRL